MCRLFSPGMFQASVSCHAEVSNTIRTPHASFEEKKRASTLLLLDAVTFVIFNFYSFPINLIYIHLSD